MSGYKLFCILILISLILMEQSPVAIDMKNCVGMWLFDHGGGNIAKDSSGNGNDGILMNDPKWVNAKIGSALELDGKDDWVNMGDNDILKPSAMASSCWFIF